MEFVKLYRSIKYTRRRQLFERLKLTFKRKLNVIRGNALRQRMTDSPLQLNLKQPLLLPLLAPRFGKLYEIGDAYEFRLLNECHTLKHPIDWHKKELKHGTRLWLLNLHYMEYLEEASDVAFINLIGDWIDNCQPYHSGYWLDDWNSFSLSIRCVVWMQQFAIRQTRLPNEFKRVMLGSLTRQLSFLRKNLELDIGGNHLLKNIKALLWAGRFFECLEAEGWSSLGQRLLAKELHEQILPDGMHYERSPSYHAQVFVDLLECYVALPASSLKQELYRVLERAAQVLVDTTHPDGFCSHFNDGGLTMSYKPDVCLAAWEAVSGIKASPQQVFAFKEAGYYGLRIETDYLIVDCGDIAPDFLPAHGHGDLLAFEWSVNGQRIIIDAGVYEYNQGPQRNFSRSTIAHNTVTLDEQDQCDFWGAFRVARRARARVINFQTTKRGFELHGEHDGYKHLDGQPLHRRYFKASQGRLEITDEILGGKGQKVEARLLLHPACELEPIRNGYLIKRQDVSLRLESHSHIALTKSRWFPDFGQELSCQQLVLLLGNAPCRHSMLITKV